MTHHFDEFGRGRRKLGADAAQGLDQDAWQADYQVDCQADCQDTELNSDCCSPIQRDQFELLSAYLDGEVTAAERRQVESWLATDPQTQRLYSRLQSLRHGLQTLPIAQSSQNIDQLVDRVTARAERQPRRLAWGGLAAAGLLIGVLFNAMPPESYSPSVAQRSNPQRATTEEVPSDGLMIALNQPPIAIPRTTQKSGTLR